MVTTRHSQPLAAAEPESPNQLKWLSNKDIKVNDALEKLGKKANITFPLPDETESPAKKNKSPTHEIKRLFSVLFYTNRSALVRQIHTFLEWLPLWRDHHDEKVKFLQDALSNAHGVNYSSIRSSSRAKRVTLGKHTSSPPHSPTMSVKHVSSAQTRAITEIQLPAATRVVSNTTSNNTSFANTSFWSEAQKGSQDPPSPATTVDDSFHSTQEYGSSLSEGAVSKFSAKLKDAYDKDITMQLDGANDIVTPTQETYYGSSPRSSQLELGRRSQPLGVLAHDLPEAEVERPSDGAAVNSSETTESKRSSGEALESSATTMDKRLDDVAIKSTEVSPNKSSESARENVRVRNIAQEGLTNIRLPPSILKLDLDRRSAFYMVAQDCKIDPGHLAQQWKQPWRLPSLYKIARKHMPGFRPFSSYTDNSLRAKMRITDSREGRIMTLEHVRAHKQLSNQLERMFGHHRFLTVDVDSLDPPECLGISDQKEFIQSRFQEMLTELQEFLGCTWIQFHAQEKTRRKAGDDPIKSGSKQYTFFAINGPDLEPIDFYQVLNRVLQIEVNKDMSACKLYSRLDLAMSRTHYILIYPSEIEFISDTCAIDELEDTRCNDPASEFRIEFKPNVVMNDGCCEAAEIIFQWIRNELDLDDIPTGAQIRIAGSKGMIYLKRPDMYNPSHCTEGFASRATTPDQRRALIHIVESMRKVKLPNKAFNEDSFDKELLALRIVQVVHQLKPSYLYSDFLPILIDRHVPKEALENHVRLHAEQDSKDFQEAISSSDQLRQWLHTQYAAREDQRRDSEIEKLAGFPTSDAEKAIQMLDSGFEPMESDMLAELVRNIGKSFFNQRKKAYKIPLPQSTMALTIADCGRYLKPGQIQLNFSQGFRDPRSGRRIAHLEGWVLISRLPAGRPSDIRKVWAMYKPELSHIKDQVIFPTTGHRPLADQSSGGDYDGDKFWICWDQTLVEPFLNAPVPSSLPAPESIGIKVNNMPTRGIISDATSEEQARAFVRMGTANRMKRSLLGKITKDMERQGHHDNNIDTDKYRALADAKDIIIDSDKNGLEFSPAAYAEYKKAHGISNPPDPAYAKQIGDEEDEDDTRTYAPINPHNILDKIHCIILPQILEKAISDMNEKLPGTIKPDNALSKEYEDRLSEARDDPALHDELSRLESELAKVKTEWGKQVGIWKATKPLRKSLAWETAVLTCRAVFDAIVPMSPTHPVVREWTRESGSSPTTWDLIKASALAKFHNKGKMWFSIAGSELCWLKLWATGPARPILTAKYIILKPRKRKRVANEAQDEETDEAEGSDIDMEER